MIYIILNCQLKKRLTTSSIQQSIKEKKIKYQKIFNENKELIDEISKYREIEKHQFERKKLQVERLIKKDKKN